jgi:hypothetical protein
MFAISAVTDNIEARPSTVGGMILGTYDIVNRSPTHHLLYVIGTPYRYMRVPLV